MNCNGKLRTCKKETNSNGGCFLQKLRRKSFEKYQTGKRAVIHVYRGISNAPADPGDLGIGRYFSTSRATAQAYGKLTETVVELQNPKVLTVQEALGLIEKFQTVSQPSKENYAKLTRYFLKQGYDGLIVQGGYDSPPDHITVVVFPQPQKKSPPSG